MPKDNGKELEQIEADVVVSLWSDSYNLGQVNPIWECNLNSKQLFEAATEMALAFAEECGGGGVTFKIHDFREEKAD